MKSEDAEQIIEALEKINNNLANISTILTVFLLMTIIGAIIGIAVMVLYIPTITP